MTVSAQSNKIIYTGNGATTSFPFTFPGVATSNIDVYFTDTDGSITLLSPVVYSVVLTAAVPPNPTGIGGTVTYPLAGSPIAAGTKLTIIRVMDLTQPTSLANQGTMYQQVMEAMVDQAVLRIQQVNEQIGRQITVPVSDDAPAALPTAAERASKIFGFDIVGNPTAVELTDAGQVLVSSVMIPVVEAASLTLARTALGLGTMATKNIGAGLEDDGAGAIRVISTPAADAVSQAVTASFHMSERHATGAITYTLPKIDTLFAGFGFFVYALTGPVTFAINATDLFNGATAGVSMIIPAGSSTWISCDGVNTWYIRPVQLFTQGAAHNLRLNAGVAANDLTISVKDRNGNDPSPLSPIMLTFRDPTLGNGNPIYASLASALSIVSANGASYGSTNNVPFRLWAVAFLDAGIVRIALINCLSSLNFFPLGKLPLASSTLVSAAATAAHTFYTNGAGVASKAYVILGYLTWEDGLVTAGAWSAAPTSIELFGHGTPLPGDELQAPKTATGAVATGTTLIPSDDSVPTILEGDQYMTQAITPVSKANILDIIAQGFWANTADTAIALALFQDATSAALAVAPAQPRTNQVIGNGSVTHRMLANTTIATTFRIRAGAQGAGTTTFNGAAGARLYGGALSSYMQATERMG